MFLNPVYRHLWVDSVVWARGDGVSLMGDGKPPVMKSEAALR